MDGDFVLYLVMNTLLVIALSPLFVSMIRKVKAWTQGRHGPSIFQTYYTIAKLLKKEVIYSSSASRIMRVTPLVNIAAVLVAALFVPLVFVPAPVGGDREHHSLPVPARPCEIFHGTGRSRSRVVRSAAWAVPGR